MVIGCAREDSLSGSATTSSAASAAPISPSAVIAKVGSRTITIADLLRHIKTMPAGQRPRFRDAKQRRLLAERLIDDELFAQEALRRGLDRDPSAVFAIRKALADAQLARIAESLPGLKEIDAEAVSSYYRQNPNRFVLPERRGVAVIGLVDRTAAARILKRSLGLTGDSEQAWQQLVSSHRGKAVVAGALGVVGPPDSTTGAHEKVPAPLRRAVFALSQVGQIAPRLINVGATYYVLRYQSRTAGQTRSLAESELGIRKLLRQQQAERRREQLISALRKRFGVRIDVRALATVGLPEGFESYVPYWEKDGGTRR